MSYNKKQIAVLVSGNGSNLQAIIDAIKSNQLKNTEVAIVISNKPNAYALHRAQTEGIKNVFINPSEFNTIQDFDKKIIDVLKTHNIDLIVLAGYTKILSSELINAFNNKIINIHPSLLPLFGGKGMYGQKVHEAVLKSGVKETGCTVHFVTQEVDAGPIILQKKIPVLSSDTIETLSKKVLGEEHSLLIEGINLALFENLPIKKAENYLQNTI